MKKTLTIAGAILFFASMIACADEALFLDDFESGSIKNWRIDAKNIPYWNVEKIDNNYILNGAGPSGLNGGSDTWQDYSFKAKIEILSGGCELAFRVTPEGRYYIGFDTVKGAFYLDKDKPWGVKHHLKGFSVPLDSYKWYTINVTAKRNNIKVFMGKDMLFEYTDNSEPLLKGGIQIISLNNSEVRFDDISVENLKN